MKHTPDTKTVSVNLRHWTCPPPLLLHLLREPGQPLLFITGGYELH